MAVSAPGTYVYCVVASPRAPRPARARRGLPGTGRVRLLDVDRGLFAVVADAPLKLYGEAAIARGLSDLAWVSRAAVAHEGVVESFIDADAVLPMKLFTIFSSDDRAIAHVREQLPRLRPLIKRVAKHHEWGVRVILGADGSRGTGRPGRAARPGEDESGLAFLTRKKAQRDAAVERAERARETVAALYDRLAAHARFAKRRLAGELPVQGGPLLLDAAFLVPHRRSASFRALAAREARRLSRDGYALMLTGPWPPYSFVQD